MKTKHPIGSIAGTALCSLAVLVAVACGTGDAQTTSSHPRPSSEGSPESLVQQFGGRAPRPCPAIRSKPTDVEAAILAQCTMEGPFGTSETLLTDVQVHITGSRKFQMQDDNRKDIDMSAPVYTLTGYAKNYACGAQSFSPGKNCTMVEMPDSPGACWRTNYGEWRCNFVNVGVGYHPFVPPPTTY